MFIRKTIIAFFTLLLTLQFVGLNSYTPCFLNEENAWKNFSDNPLEQDEDSENELVKLEKNDLYDVLTQGGLSSYTTGLVINLSRFSESFPLEPVNELLSPPPNFDLFF